MRKVTISIILGLVLLLSTVGAALAVTNGRPDGNNHPYVGLLVFDDAEGPAWRCSGSLIAPNVVLTAGHCTDGAVAARVWFDENVQTNTEYPFSGDTSYDGVPHTYPGFCIECGNGLPGFAAGDVGVVVLTEPVTMDEYAGLPEAGLVGTLKNKTPVDIVGYGVQFQAKIPGNQLPQPPPFYRWTGPRVRLYAPTELVSGKFVHSDEFLRLAMNASGGSGGTCFGDSGGPDLLGGTNTVLAVNSYVTNVNCSGVGYSARVDIPEVLEWIEGFLE
jgi:Trypsin